jgi:ribonuclease J
MESPVVLTIHRGTRQIGGSCVELECDGSRIILDAGMPLDVNDSKVARAGLNVQGLFADAMDEKPVDALLISHAHQDHYGLLDRIRQDVPVYMSEGTAKLVEITRLFSRKPPLTHGITPFSRREPITIGPFTILPHLVDHSAFDAHAFEIEAGGKRVFYSGDFRGHGPIAQTLDIIRDRVTPGVDAILLEGTMLGRADEEVLTEQQLADRAQDICRNCPKAVLVYQSGQNVSRFVSFYKAARHSGRECIVDFYAAHVLTEMAAIGGVKSIPFPGHPQLQGVSTWFPYRLTDRMMNTGHRDIPNRYARWKWTKEDIAARMGETMLFVRPGMESDLERMGDLRGSVLIYSLWEGYREDKNTKNFLDKVESLGITIQSLHTSGHATIPTLQELVDALRPKNLIPIHTEHPGEYGQFGVDVQAVEDGVPVTL